MIARYSISDYSSQTIDNELFADLVLGHFSIVRISNSKKVIITSTGDFCSIFVENVDDLSIVSVSSSNIKIQNSIVSVRSADYCQFTIENTTIRTINTKYCTIVSSNCNYTRITSLNLSITSTDDTIKNFVISELFGDNKFDNCLFESGFRLEGANSAATVEMKNCRLGPIAFHGAAYRLSFYWMGEIQIRDCQFLFNSDGGIEISNSININVIKTSFFRVMLKNMFNRCLNISSEETNYGDKVTEHWFSNNIDFLNSRCDTILDYQYCNNILIKELQVLDKGSNISLSSYVNEAKIIESGISGLRGAGFRLLNVIKSLAEELLIRHGSMQVDIAESTILRIDANDTNNDTGLSILAVRNSVIGEQSFLIRAISVINIDDSLITGNLDIENSVSVLVSNTNFSRLVDISKVCSFHASKTIFADKLTSIKAALMLLYDSRMIGKITAFESNAFSLCKCIIDQPLKLVNIITISINHSTDQTIDYNNIMHIKLNDELNTKTPNP